MNPFRLSAQTRPAPAARPQMGGVTALRERGAWARSAHAPEVTHAPQAISAPRVEPSVDVPWRVTQRTSSGLVEVRQCGAGPLHSVRFTLAGGGLLGLSLPRTVFPGEQLQVLVYGAEAESALRAPDALLVLRWFQPDGQELLWPIAL